MKGLRSSPVQPYEYVVTYRAPGPDDAEHQFELDQPRRALDGYVPTSRRWVKMRWGMSDVLRTLSGLLVWGGIWRQHRDWAEKAVLFGPPAVLEVTYRRQGDEELEC